MWDLRGVIGELAITQLAMVGTHNSGTSHISWRSKFGRDAPGPLRDGGVVSAVTRFFAGGILGGWARCQRMTVAQQLDYGVRYIDLRVTPHPPQSTALYITHGLVSVLLADVLETVRRFVTAPASANEFVLLDFQHVFLSPDDPGHAELFRQLSALSDVCVTNAVDWTVLPLRALWAGTARVVVVMAYGVDPLCASFVHARECFLSSPWKNESTTTDLLRALADPSPSLPSPRVFVTQAVLTPDGTTVARGLLTCGAQPCSVRALAKRSNRSLVEWFWQHNTSFSQGESANRNVLMLDYPEACDVEVHWDGGSLRGSVIDVCVYINLARCSST